MKILLLNSSYRKDGNTARVLECIKEEILLTAGRQGLSAEFETVSLAHSDVQICRGCRGCFDRGEKSCPLKDEVPGIKERLDSADGVVLASPVYVEDVNGIMKNWIDRMAFNNHRPAFSGKPAIILTTSGTYSSKHALKTMERAFNAWGGISVGKDRFRTGALTGKEDIKIKNLKKIKKLSARLYNAITHKTERYPSVYSLIYFKVQQKYWQRTKDTWTFDYTYWKEKGWLNNDCSYYTRNSAGWIKIKFARLLGSIISGLFT
ncbi:flavodoxin family protein [Ruminiclostridium cellobioparum]|uniref:NADPH-dependent FMN reductase n=1 Tax=Ruminiclostridium cellobioparum subsp. termitidis CT1112 TaxID=1195236 RepID=S0FM39_RUMCE|nr:flavodoxin family protein [Ruminiclostridium cellobioparum]EMS69548.1 NADPH-dependent FMN reductase [Ruminiclostridium cellobioparum subsp. termitidis CT1112]